MSKKSFVPPWSQEQSWDVVRNEDGFLEFDVTFRIKGDITVPFSKLMMHCLHTDFVNVIGKYLCYTLRSCPAEEDPE